MIRQVWLHMGATPFEDVDKAGQSVGQESIVDTAREVANRVP
jgi:hypothetical protein